MSSNSLVAVLVLAAAPTWPASFVDVTRSSGVRFQHQAGWTSAKNLPETMGAGVCLIDYDDDDRLDLYFVDGGQVESSGFAPGPPDRLYRNLGGLRFEDVTAHSGINATGYGMGCAVGDIDNDGDSDLFVSGYGSSSMWWNDGGRFHEASSALGLSRDGWTVSSAFADFDHDGILDLYVSAYVNFDFASPRYCGDLSRGIRSYCHPDVFDGLPHALFMGQGDGRFIEQAALRGIDSARGKGLGVVISDLDADGDPDIYAANDSTINFLFRNEGGGRFSDQSLRSGAGLDVDGKAEASMGVDAGDVDGDGTIDLFVTNLDMETNTLYRGIAGGRLFRDDTASSGLGPPSLPKVGFGTGFIDYDSDGDLDLIVVNGHILDNVAQTRPPSTWAQTPQLFENDGGGHFRDVSAGSGAIFSIPLVGRGLALGDLDDDGDIDAVITTNGGNAVVLANHGPQGHRLRLQLEGRDSNRDAYGARVTATFGPRTILRECRSATSYLSQGDARVFLGSGAATGPSTIVVRWPGGAIDTVTDVAVDQALKVMEGRGVISARPF